jgi:hypothetical protein
MPSNLFEFIFFKEDVTIMPVEEFIMDVVSEISQKHGVDIYLCTQPGGGFTIQVTRGEEKEEATIPSWHPDEDLIVKKIMELIEELDRKTITL